MRFIGQNPPPLNIHGAWIPPPGDVGEWRADHPQAHREIPSTADKITQNLSDLGTTFSPLVSDTGPIIVKTPTQSNSLVLWVLLGAVGLMLYLWYRSRERNAT